MRTALWLLVLGVGMARAAVPIVEQEASPEDAPLVAAGKATPLYYDAGDAKVVQIAVRLLSEDVERVTGSKPEVRTTAPEPGADVVFVGTLGKSPLIDGLVAAGKFDAGDVKGKWESWVVATVVDPVPGIHRALVIAGADRRGTAFGVFSLSEALGVSPWYWWADVPATHRAAAFVKAGRYVQASPAVKYRGIFLNDEDWGLQPWAAKTFEPETKDIGPKTYAKIFELLLRLRANTIWPAMHPCTKAFNLYPENKRVADDYAIVMGSSHAEPMLRDNVTEWDAASRGEWNYQTNGENVKKYWEERVSENGAYENLYTLGMRGIHDGAMPAKGTTEEKARLMEKIFADQRDMLSRLVNPDLAKVGQIFVPYKEVLKIYQAGLRVPEDVTLVWVDDNYGYIRQLSDAGEQKRSGGAGVYYHLSYWGSPADYLWLCTTPPALTWEEMTKAYDYGTRNVWIANVGDIKPGEIGMEWFLQLAWDVDGRRDFNQRKWLAAWAGRQFGTENADAIGAILDEYYRLNYAPKPEHLDSKEVRFTPSEGAARLERFARLLEQLEVVEAKLAANQKSSFLELVAYPVRGAARMNQKFLAAAAGDDAKSTAAYEAIRKETAAYNAVENGKWSLMMDIAPRKQKVFGPAAKEAGDGEPAWPQGTLAMEAEHYARAMDRGPGRWTVIDGLARSGNAVGVLPATDFVAIPPESIATQAPGLEYDVETRLSGPVTVTLYCLPTHAVYPGRKLRYAVAIDDEKPTVVDIETSADDKKEGAWSGNVLRGAAIHASAHTLAAPGRHTIKVWSLDPGLLYDKVVLSSQPLPYSFYGPPENVPVPSRSTL
ncbi:Glycosyl hydrolase family 115 [Verrucomicrobium sp. GAS474]|uniref:glycosyl hydrolase 115 family protein n=1 Tax=Verrucomicrobium sp. GAS474 TaxID=1882831 RepID=UPI000879BACE|nr:glycosyl hydrolase 115 family protein [Verrucomicrobium sp. GAS474]SDU27740.1 Glycosyl hydrolase family 115 [Verrucomicrobium sp. GAS474]